ncbi:hypothetical protein DFH28DRAFT_888746, partial [Melampsora americana]
EVSLQGQADERINHTAKQMAYKSISIVVWAAGAGSEGQLVTPDLCCVIAPTWPRFALAQCHMFVDLGHKTCASWDGNVCVWNNNKQIWALVNVKLSESYPTQYRKILVLMPGTNITQCEDVQRHITSVTTKSTKDRMRLYPYITPTNKHYNVIYIDGSPTPIPAKEGTEGGQILISKGAPYVDVARNTSDKLRDSDDNNEEDNLPVDPLNISRKCAITDNIITDNIIDSPNLRSALEGICESTPTPANQTRSWPSSVKMDAMKTFLDTVMEGTLLMSKAWQNQFGISHGKYSLTTVSNYWKWMIAIGCDRLNAFAATHTHMSVAQRRTHHFAKEWRSKDEPQEDKAQTNKRAKI